MTQISVTSGNRPTGREQIETILKRARELGAPVRIRIPYTMYDYDGSSRTYQQIRDTVWNITLGDPNTVTPEHIETFADVLGKVMVALAEQGPDVVLEKLGLGTTHLHATDVQSVEGEPAQS